MRTCSLEFLFMTTSTLLASWFVVINRVFADCCASSPGTIWHLLTTSLRMRSFAPTKTSAAFAGRRVSRRGYIESPTIVFGKMPGAEKNLSELMNHGGKVRLTQTQLNRD